MNPDLLLAHYDRIADAPDAIARLRRFILDLAVRGKLVPQDPNDEPASELLKRIVKKKARLVKAGEISKEKPLPPVQDDGSGFDLPAGWALVRLGDISQLVTSGSRDWAKHYSNNGAIFVRMGNLSKGHYRLRLEHIQHVKPPSCGEGTRTRLEGGDILISITGDVGMLGLIPDDFGEAYINQHTAMVRPMNELKGRFLPELFRSSFAQDQFNEPQRGIKNSFRLSDVTQFIVPLPPLAEQHRIVAKVDELMALCDRLEATRKEREATRDRLALSSLAHLNAPDPETFQADAHFALNNLSALTKRPDQIKQLRQTILNLAVRGKLVPQDPNDEPASELLKRVVKAQTQVCLSEGIRARPTIAKLKRGDMWFEFPESWALSSFDDIFVIVSGITKGQKVAASDAIDVPYLRVANVQRGYLDLSVIKIITVRMLDKERYSLRKGDILMTEGGDWDKLGRAAIWRDEIPGCIHQNHIFRVRPPSKDISSEWVTIYANSLLGRSFFEEASKQTTNLASINMTQLRGFPIPLPPLAEQHRIVAKVDELMSLCDRLKASLTASDDTRRRLLESILHRLLDLVSTAMEVVQ